jgi:uncharacterized protein (DUF427 family)
MKATWENVVLAESNQTVVVEGNHYFPPDSIKREYLQASDTHSTCPWNGIASYYNIQVGDQVNRDSAWYYPEPKEAARSIKDHLAFWRGVNIIE